MQKENAHPSEEKVSATSKRDFTPTKFVFVQIDLACALVVLLFVTCFFIGGRLA